MLLVVQALLSPEHVSIVWVWHDASYDKNLDETCATG